MDIGPAPRLLLIAILGALPLLWVGGCQDRMFREGDQLSQFDRYHLLRGEPVRRSEPDELGRSRPALRERLGPHRQTR